MPEFHVFLSFHENLSSETADNAALVHDLIVEADGLAEAQARARENAANLLGVDPAGIRVVRVKEL